MKKIELRKLIREEIQKLNLTESVLNIDAKNLESRLNLATRENGIVEFEVTDEGIETWLYFVRGYVEDSDLVLFIRAMTDPDNVNTEIVQVGIESEISRDVNTWKRTIKEFEPSEKSAILNYAYQLARRYKVDLTTGDHLDDD